MVPTYQNRAHPSAQRRSGGNSLNPVITSIGTTWRSAGTVEDHVSAFASRLIALWQRTPDSFAPAGVSRTVEQQKEEESRIAGLLHADRGERVNQKKSALRHLQSLKSSIRSAVAGSVREDFRETAEEILREFSDAGDRFVREAEEFDAGLQPEEIFQALRNLWIINSLQTAFGLPIRLNPSGFAYSLMYPYTDNYLDDPLTRIGAKKEFNRILARRLEGSIDPPVGKPLTSLFDLVALVESEYPRSAFPDVYASLLAIQRAQERSLLQQSGARGSHPDIVHLSVEKGGASVLADAYLAKGRLTPREAWFAFRFGVFLQFIDDLQDVETDARDGHRTLFTLAGTDGKLDSPTNRLLRFQREIFSPGLISRDPRGATLLELMRDGCRSLVIESIALNAPFFSARYLERMERYSRVRFGFIRDLHDEMRAKEHRLRKTFKRGFQYAARREIHSGAGAAAQTDHRPTQRHAQENAG